jgi:hypothetical protein
MLGGVKMKMYNPFKMWGSYIIPIIAIYSYLYQAFTSGVFCPKLNFVITQQGTLYCAEEFNSYMGLFGFMLNPILWYILVIIGGVLFGWGIHSLFRRFSK